MLPPRYLDRGLPVPLAQAIVESLAQIRTWWQAQSMCSLALADQSVRAQAAENIVLTGASLCASASHTVGGSSQFAGLQEVLEDKLVELMPRELQKVSWRVCVRG